MSLVKLHNQTGQVIGDVNLDDAVFGIEPNKQVLFDAVQLYLANSRQATSKTKRRDEVRGGGRKPWRQKGTGRARQGSTRSPQWRGGGIAFGPTGLQNYKLSMNKKVHSLALKSALSTKLLENKVVVVDKFELEQPKTKTMISLLEGLNTSGKVLIVVSESSMNDSAMLSTFNIPNVMLAYSDQITVYDILNSQTLMLTVEAKEIVEEALLNG